MLGSLVCAGCSKDGHFDPFPPVTDGTPRDAAIDAPRTISGTVCLLVDLRNAGDEEGCDPSIGGLTVSLGDAMATSEVMTGSFTINVLGSETDLAWHVEGPGIRTTRMPLHYDPDADALTTLPVMSEAKYVALFAGNGGIEASAQGALIVQVVRPVGPLANATITTAAAVRYDGASATVWDTDSTGPKGLAWLPMLPAGPFTYNAQPMTGAGLPSDRAVVIEDKAITFDIVDSI